MGNVCSPFTDCNRHHRADIRSPLLDVLGPQELGTEIKPIPAVIDRDLYCR